MIPYHFFSLYYFLFLSQVLYTVMIFGLQIVVLLSTEQAFLQVELQFRPAYSRYAFKRFMYEQFFQLKITILVWKIKFKWSNKKGQIWGFKSAL